LYKNAEAGKYKNCKPSDEAIERWKKLANKEGYLPSIFEKDGIKFDFIPNSIEYDAVLNTIRMIVLDEDTYKSSEDGQSFDITGKHLDAIHVTPEMIRRAPRTARIMTHTDITPEAKRKFAEILGLGKKDGKITVVNNNLEIVLGKIIQDLKRF